MPIKLISWNVNGVRSAEKKGLLSFLASEKPFLLGLQETKGWEEQLSDGLKNPPGYRTYWSRPERKGYSGVGVFAAVEPVSVSFGFGVPKFDAEGRVVMLEYKDFYFLNIYFPNGRMDAGRLAYKLEFYGEFLKYCDRLAASGKGILACGDFNTAHKEIDLAHPSENSGVSGFLPEERAWMDRFVGWGFSDTFRMFCGEPGRYTWWDVRTHARERDIGWRLDYFLASPAAVPHVTGAGIMKEVMGSDHCPVSVELNYKP